MFIRIKVNNKKNLKYVYPAFSQRGSRNLVKNKNFTEDNKRLTKSQNKNQILFYKTYNLLLIQLPSAKEF